MTPERDTFVTLDELLQIRNVPKRDCRSCPKFVPDPDGLACGWCEAHKQWVKLYSKPEVWYSQCQFRYLREERVITR